MERKAEFPHDEQVDLSRRRLWAQLIGHLAAFREELAGNRHLSLAHLKDMPEAALMEVIPVFRKNGGFFLQGERLYGRSEDGEEPKGVRDCTTEEAYALSRFDAGTPLGDIGEELEKHFGLAAGSGFELARDLFLELAQQGICRPAAPHWT